jgi:3-dehydroquinate dehydratase-2
VPRVLVVNGPNLSLLGSREPEVYGTDTLEGILHSLHELARGRGVEVETFQSNHEGEIIDFLHANASAEGLIINPGALTHYSYAIREAIVATKLVAVEVHLSNLFAREEFRHHSVVAPVCAGQIIGLGKQGYLLALRYLMKQMGC